MDREEVLQRYRNLKARWDANEDLRQRMPEAYEDICSKLTALESGASFQIVDKTDELKNLIAFAGGQIPRCNFKANGELINIHNGITYEKACDLAKTFNYNSSDPGQPGEGGER